MKDKLRIEYAIEKVNFSRRILYGFLMGIAELVPGLGGGIISYILKIYEDMMFAYSQILSFRTSMREKIVAIKYIAPIVLMSFVGMVICAKLISFLLMSYQTIFISIVIGIIAAQIPGSASRVKEYKKGFFEWAMLVIGISVVVIIGILANATGETLISSAEEIPNGFYLFISGLLVGVAMLLPGLSSSVVMIILGIYGTVIYSINNIYLVPLIIIGSGIGIGIVLFTKLIVYFVDNHYLKFTMLNVGLLIGALIYLTLTIIPNGNYGQIILWFIIGLSLSVVALRFIGKEKV